MVSDNVLNTSVNITSPLFPNTKAADLGISSGLLAADSLLSKSIGSPSSLYSERTASELKFKNDDSLILGDGSGTIFAGKGKDIIDAGEKASTIFASDGNKIITGSPSDDTIYATAGDDIINAGDGNNRVFAGKGNNRVLTGSGNDFVTAGDGNNQIYTGKYTLTNLGTFGTEQANLRDINDAGQIIGWTAAGTGATATSSPFLLQDGQKINLGSLGGANGQTVGYSQDGLSQDRAFVWNNGAIQDLNSLVLTNPSFGGSKVTLTRATGINNWSLD